MGLTDRTRNGARSFRLPTRIRAVLLCIACLAPALVYPAPQDLVLMLDNSGSMRRNDPDALTGVAVRAFLERLEGDHRVAIVAFDQNVKLLMPLTPLDDSSRGRILDSLDAINYAGRLTNSPAALERALYELREYGRAGATKSIIFLTDGIVDVAPEGADAGDVEKARWMKTTLADEAADSQVRIFAVAFTDDADFELIQTLARRTAGEYYRAYSAADIDDVFESIRRELSTRSASPGAVVSQTPTSPPVDSGTTASSPPGRGTLSTSREPTTGDDRASPKPTPTDAGTPDTTLPVSELPRAEPPAVTLPPVELPRVSIPGSTEPPDGASPPVDASASPRVEATPRDPPPGDEAIERTTAGGGAEPSAETPPPETPPLLALAVGGLALILALAALAIVVLRRRATPPAATDEDLMPRAFLSDIDDSTSQKSYELADRPVIVGRLSGPATEAADYIVIDESTVGRRHAIIEYREHAFWITDQDSLNGTFVNNARVEAPTRLKHGDRIRFHRHEFEFLMLDMFETDRTMMSDTMFTDLAKTPGAGKDADGTAVRGPDATTKPGPGGPGIART